MWILSTHKMHSKVQRLTFQNSPHIRYIFFVNRYGPNTRAHIINSIRITMLSFFVLTFTSSLDICCQVDFFYKYKSSNLEYIIWKNQLIRWTEYRSLWSTHKNEVYREGTVVTNMKRWNIGYWITNLLFHFFLISQATSLLKLQEKRWNIS